MIHQGWCWTACGSPGVQLGRQGRLCGLAAAEVTPALKTNNTKQKSTRITTNWKPQPNDNQPHFNRTSTPLLYWPSSAQNPTGHSHAKHKPQLNMLTKQGGGGYLNKKNRAATLQLNRNGTLKKKQTKRKGRATTGNSKNKQSQLFIAGANRKHQNYGRLYLHLFTVADGSCSEGGHTRHRGTPH